MVLVAASRTAAKASGNRSSRDSPLANRSLRVLVSFLSSSSDSCWNSVSREFTALVRDLSLARTLPSPARRILSKTDAKMRSKSDGK